MANESEGMRIQWYPGHMAKARRMLAEHLKLIDVVVELVDARAPLATRNPDFDDLFSSKARVVLLNKADMADPAVNKRWIQYYRARGIDAAEIVATGKPAAKAAAALIERAAKPKVEAMRKKGVNKVVRCMVVGIPNVGKSTLINRLAGVNRAQVGDKPGVTKGKQWVHITPYLELMDTPGLLWPKLESERLSKHLAYIGSVNDEIMDIERLATELISELVALCPEAVTARYACVLPETEKAQLLTRVAESRHFVVKGGEPDTERAARIVLDEYRAGRIVRVSLETPPEAGEDA